MIADNSYDSNTTTQSDSENQEWTPTTISAFIKSFPASSHKIPADKYKKLLSIAETNTATLSNVLYTTTLCGKHALLDQLLENFERNHIQALQSACNMPYQLEGVLILNNLLEAAMHKGIYKTIDILSRHKFNTALENLIPLLHLNTKKPDEPFYIAEIILRKYLDTQQQKLKFEDVIQTIENNKNYTDLADRTAEQRRQEHLATYLSFEEQITKAQKRQNTIDNQPIIVLTKPEGRSVIIHHKNPSTHVDYYKAQAEALEKCNRSIQK